MQFVAATCMQAQKSIWVFAVSPHHRRLVNTWYMHLHTSKYLYVRIYCYSYRCITVYVICWLFCIMCVIFACFPSCQLHAHATFYELPHQHQHHRHRPHAMHHIPSKQQRFNNKPFSILIGCDNKSCGCFGVRKHTQNPDYRRQSTACVWLEKCGIDKQSMMRWSDVMKSGWSRMRGLAHCVNITLRFAVCSTLQ